MTRIGFMLPTHFSFNRSNGIRQEALLKQRGLSSLGHQVELLSPWSAVEGGSLEIVHFFYGGLPCANIAEVVQIAPCRLVFSTIIDSNQSFLNYRMAAWLGGLSRRVHTIQGEFKRQCHIADAVVVRSQHEMERVVKGLGIPQAKVHLVHLGIDIDPIDATRAGADEREGIFHLSAFGQERKNVLRLIAAVGPTGIPLTIAGSCSQPELVRVQQAAKPFTNITIRGFLSPAERDELYYRSRVFALPSLHEGTGLSALEAAARGCNVVITRNGGPPDYFSDIGHLVDPLSIDDLRAKILLAYKDGIPGKVSSYITARFNARICAEQLLKVYHG